MAESDAAPDRKRDGLVALVALVIVLATVVLGAVLPAMTHPREASTPATFDREPTCAEWTDGCIVCQRTPQGVACSTPGIACLREAPRCLKRQGA